MHGGPVQELTAAAFAMGGKIPDSQDLVRIHVFQPVESDIQGLFLKLWDEDQQKMVGFAELRRR